MITLAEFRTKFPELSGIDDNIVNSAIVVADEIDKIKTENAMLYCTAHIAVLENDERQAGIDAGSGEVMSESIGSATTSFVTMASRRDSLNAFFTRTPYGRTYLILQSRRVFTPAIIGVDT